MSTLPEVTAAHAKLLRVVRIQTLALEAKDEEIARLSLELKVTAGFTNEETTEAFK